jgi:hypothetical protein
MSTAVDRLRFARLARFSGLRIFTASSTGRVRALEPTAALIARMRQDVPMEQQKSLQPRRPKPSPRRGAQLRNLKERAAVLIGVQHYFNLPVLATSLDCVGMMRTWALSQGFQPERVVQLTDEREPVRITDVYYAIRKLLESQQIEQLFIYFEAMGSTSAVESTGCFLMPPIARMPLSMSKQALRLHGMPELRTSSSCRTPADSRRRQFRR